MNSLGLVVELWRQGKREQAQVMCEALLAAKQDDAQALSLMAELYSSNGQPAKAVEYLRRLCAECANDAATFRQLGNAQLTSNDSAGAVRSYRHALELEPDNVRCLNNLGQALLATGDRAGAVDCFERAVHLQPDYAIAHNNLGNALHERGDDERALLSYRAAVASDPNLAEAHFNLGRALCQQGHDAQGVESFDRCLTLRPGSAEALFARGNALQRLRRFRQALDSYAAILRIRPGHLEALSNGASVLLILQRPQEALEQCEQVLRSRPHFVPAMNNRAGALAQLGRLSEALATCDEALQIAPTDVEVRCNRGQVLLAMNRPSEAEAEYQQAIDLRPDSAAANNGLGAAIAARGDTGRAMQYLQRAMALDASYAPAAQNAGYLQLGARQVSASLESFERALVLDPESVLLLVNRGVALLQLMRPSEAKASFAHALRLDPERVEALLGSTSALLHLGQPREALPFADRAVRLRPDLAQAHANRAAVLLALKRPGDALRCCDHALELQPDIVEAHFNRAEALRGLHRHDWALEAYDRALSLRPQYVPALFGRGQTCMEMADQTGAAESFRRVLELDPTNAAARTTLLFTAIPIVPDHEIDIDAARSEFSADLSRFEAWLAQQESVNELAIVGITQPFYLAYQERPNRALLARYGAVCARLMELWDARQPQALLGDSAPRDGRLRLGIVTAYLRDHSVYRALVKGWLTQLDPARVQCVVFHLGADQDQETQSARKYAPIIECGGLSLPACVQAIRSQSLDALLYPEIGMDPLTAQLAGLRLARHQMVAWGHPETSGLPTIDYYLSAEDFETSGSDAQYSERLVRLPNLGCYYEPAGIIGVKPDLRTLGLAADAPLLLCAGTPYKYAPEHDAVLVELAQRLGRCQIALFQAPTQALSQRLMRRLEMRFRAAGLEPSQHLFLVPWLPPEAFFGLMQCADVYLDTLGFSGFNSVMQAVECELPVVAYEGRFMRGRFASAILRRLRLDELVATDHAQFVERAVRLVRERDWRDTVRQRIREWRQSLFRDSSPMAAMTAFLASLS